jgi:hypothetical protein
VESTLADHWGAQTEQDRMDLHHEIVLQLLGGQPHKAPIVSNPQRILNVGTGTGISMGDRYGGQVSIRGGVGDRSQVSG